MTPKEKAKDLLIKFSEADRIEKRSFIGLLTAKQCVLIAVYEIINILDQEGYDEGDGKMIHWQQVKQEI